MKSATRLIDTYARRFDVTDTRVVLVDASPAAVFAAGERLADRLVLTPTRLASREGEHVFCMAAGHVKVIWDLRVEPGPESGATVSMTTRFVSADHSSHESLRAAWGVLGPVAAALSKRALSAVKRYAENQDELPRQQASTLALAA